MNSPSGGVTVSPITDGSNTVLTMTFRRDPRATDLLYSLETSSDASVWTSVVESSAGAATSGPAFVSEADAPGEAPVKVVTARQILPAGAKRYVRVKITTPPPPSFTLLYERIGGINSGFVVPALPLDLTAQRYVVEFEGATWTSDALTNYANVMFRSGNGGAMAFLRPESGKMCFFVGDNNNATSWSDRGAGSTDLWAPAAGVPYRIGFELGLGQAHVIKDGFPITQKASSVSNAINIYRRFAVSAARPDPANLTTLTFSSGVNLSALRIWRREMAAVENLVLLGDSITAAQPWETRLRQDFGPSRLIYNHGVGYRQSREMKAAVLTPFPGDRYNPANFYADVAGLYRSGAASNWVLIGIGTNDVLHYNDPPLAAGPESGGYTAATTINNILGAIADIRADNPGWKIAVRTILNLDTISGGGSYAAAETMRQAINASIMNGSVAAAADRTFNQDNVFAPAAARTDAAGADGPLYDPGYWPKYSDNPATFDVFHIHPTPIGYQTLADYIASRMR